MERLTVRESIVSQRDINKLLEPSNENQFGMNDAYYKLKYYEDMEEQGLLHKAPVPNGTPIYFVRYNDWIEEDGVHSIEYIHGATENLFGEINKDWFLTEEEAGAKFEQIKDRF